VEKIESVLKACPLVEQLWVYGNSFESCLLAVVVPQKKGLMAWAAKQGLQGSFEVRSSSLPSTVVATHDQLQGCTNQSLL